VGPAAKELKVADPRQAHPDRPPVSQAGLLNQPRVSLDLAQRAIAAVIEQAAADARRMAAVVADDRGHVICCARMDGAPERVLRFAVRKAYTAAVMGRDTVAFKRQMEATGRSLADYGDAQFTTLQGGVVAIWQGQVVGAVAVGGNTAERDEEIARQALILLGF
jgi:uncharacterized protein GlcG (DUF336 family)